MVKVEFAGRPVFDIPGVVINNGDNTIRSGGSSRTTRIRNGNRTSTRQTTFNWSAMTSRLVVTSDTDDFDEEILAHFKEEGFSIHYLPYSGDKTAYQKQLSHLADPLELGETYAIVAYGDAAALVLETCMRPTPKLCAVVAYYPPYMPKTSANFPNSLNLTIHLAGSQKFGTRHQRNYRYVGTEAGFAESDLEEYSKSDARIAWSRTLACLRKGFGIEVDLEDVVDYYERLRFEANDEDADDIEELMKAFVRGAHVDHGPTMTGGIGKKNLVRFYSQFFLPGNPPDLKRKLLSRTVGVDRVVDEVLVTFTHTTKLEWMLPGVPPTGKQVEVVAIVVVSIRGSKICSENVHWDQASVLVQVGLLDPKHVPSTFRTTEEGEEKDVKQLPVLGAEAARKVVDEEKGKSNELIPDW